MAFALSLPEAWEDDPWDAWPVAKVGKKIFAFFGSDDDPTIAVKLPESAEFALTMRDARPTPYGLGRSGWVTMPVASADVDLWEEWIEESYRVVAPKRLVKLLDEEAAE
jgi:predicted DNA-binding protein (MmcQ/YjbR family)